MAVAVLHDALVTIAANHDIDKVGVCSAGTFSEVRDALHERKAAGLHADMQFTYRNPDRSTDCLLYTSPSPRDKRQSRMPSSA